MSECLEIFDLVGINCSIGVVISFLINCHISSTSSALPLVMSSSQKVSKESIRPSLSALEKRKIFLGASYKVRCDASADIKKGDVMVRCARENLTSVHQVQEVGEK